MVGVRGAGSGHGDRRAGGDLISLDGNLGAIYPGVLSVVTRRPDCKLVIVARWRGAKAT
jgi:hypothetical protein